MSSSATATKAPAERRRGRGAATAGRASRSRAEHATQLALELPAAVTPTADTAAVTPPTAPVEPDSDRTLALRVAAGDGEAWRTLYGKWQVDLTRYGLSMGWDRELVQDLVQDTLIRAWDKRASYNPQYPYRVWLLTIFRRLAMTHYRRVRTHGKTVVEQPQKATETPWWAEGRTDMSTQLDRSDMRSVLSAVLAELRSEDQRLLVAWSEGVCQATFARELGVNPVTLRTQILRAKARFAAAFARMFPDLAASGWSPVE